ncbi:NgoMIV family type II restriction endonuclease [Cellulomonas sp. P22]|uniref:NgoMIV family type II restriction endonuclease n=1 Tax=Cellulomonas sp. P22 TaxID=3373189 RepID=UPI0037968DEC
MPAPFVKDLCLYRSDGKPNTCDASDKLSVEVGHALFDAIGVSMTSAGDEPTGAQLSKKVAADLLGRVSAADSSAVVRPEQRLNVFEQYLHVGALRDVKPGRSKEFDAAWNRLSTYVRKKTASGDSSRLEALIAGVETVIDREAEDLRLLLDQVGDESLLGLDVTVSRPGARKAPILEVALSLKWSLRTDRAQDCRTQGAKMAALRRGRMPHFGVVTMEPRPYYLNLVAGGSGDVDCAYVLDLPSLTQAVDQVYRTRQRAKGRDLFHRLVDQQRIRDYDDLVAAVDTL